MVEENEEWTLDNGFLDKCFWVEHCDECICLNFLIKEKHFYSPPIDRTEWIEWLRAEREKCHPVILPDGIRRAFDG